VCGWTGAPVATHVRSWDGDVEGRVQSRESVLGARGGAMMHEGRTPLGDRHVRARHFLCCKAGLTTEGGGARHVTRLTSGPRPSTDATPTTAIHVHVVSGMTMSDAGVRRARKSVIEHRSSCPRLSYVRFGWCGLELRALRRGCARLRVCGCAPVGRPRSAGSSVLRLCMCFRYSLEVVRGAPACASRGDA
jgi:hypothetical protein